MANLFFIHTPMQLFMAQQIIHQESLHDNVMVYDYAGGNTYYQNTYDLILIPTMWKRRVLNPARLGWNIINERKSFLKGVRAIRQKVKLLENFIYNEKTEALFFGDMLNGGYRLLAHIFYDKGIKVAFFEEGFSHYTGRVLPPPSFIGKVKMLMIDIMVYIPLYYRSYEYKVKVVDEDLNKIPKTVRFNLIPYYNQLYDKLVKTTLLLSPTLEKYLNKEQKEIAELKNDGDLVLFVNEDIAHFAEGIDNSVEEELLNTCVFPKVSKDAIFLLKFHPAESEERRIHIAEFFKKSGIKYYILSKDMNVPVEYYLQFFHFCRIFTYATAVSLYNGYLFSYTQTTRLLDDLLRICNQKGINKTNRLANIILRLDGIQKAINKGIENHVR